MICCSVIQCVCVPIYLQIYSCVVWNSIWMRFDYLKVLAFISRNGNQFSLDLSQADTFKIKTVKTYIHFGSIFSDLLWQYQAFRSISTLLCSSLSLSRSLRKSRVAFGVSTCMEIGLEKINRNFEAQTLRSNVEMSHTVRSKSVRSSKRTVSPMKDGARKYCDYESLGPTEQRIINESSRAKRVSRMIETEIKV